MRTTPDEGFAHLRTFLADTKLDLEELDNGMKTTPEGLTHLINMLVDVVNLQRKAQATPGACCEVEYGFYEAANRVTVKFSAEVDVAAPPLTTLSADNNRTLTPADIAAAEAALWDSGYRQDECNAVTAAETVLRAAGCQVPDRDV